MRNGKNVQKSTQKEKVIEEKGAEKFKFSLSINFYSTTKPTNMYMQIDSLNIEYSRQHSVE